MKNKEYMSLKKMIEYIDKALRYTEGCNFKTFSENEEKVDATVFSISQIGELVKNISVETMENNMNKIARQQMLETVHTHTHTRVKI